MRLIDADALKESLKTPIVMDEDRVKRLWEGWHECTIAVDEAIDKSPTIEERKTGEWIPFDYPWYRCSECGAVRENKSFLENYCPNCGADMRGEGHE